MTRSRTPVAGAALSLLLVALSFAVPWRWTPGHRGFLTEEVSDYYLLAGVALVLTVLILVAGLGRRRWLVWLAAVAAMGWALFVALGMRGAILWEGSDAQGRMTGGAVDVHPAAGPFLLLAAAIVALATSLARVRRQLG